MPITLEQANRLIDGVFSKAAQMGLPPLGAAVLDEGGHLKAMQRQDGLSFLRAQVCQAKAWSALAMGAETRSLAERFNVDANQQGFIQALNAMSGGRVIPLPGGVRVFAQDGSLLGAVGVSGAASEDDESCALFAIHQLGLRTAND